MSGAAAAEPAVDILINNYNYARYVPEAIESACRQTHGRVRVIVVDDGSSDDSREVLAAFENRVDLVFKPNGGQASAMNAAMEHSEGDVVMFLDADDVLHPGAAAAAAAAFAARPDLVKVQFRAEIVDADGRPTGEAKPAAHLPMPSGDMRSAELAFPYDLVWMSTSANAFRASALRRILPIPEQPFRTCADWYLVHLAALLGPVESLPGAEVSYRMHGANNYEPQATALDLGHIRETIGFAEATSPRLLALADRLGLERPARILSLADLANRMISLRLEPGQHPNRGDRRTGLVLDSVRAARRRDNVSAPMKAMFVSWFAAMAVAPRPLARQLAEAFLFPQRRSGLNRLLGRLQRSEPKEMGV